MFLESCRIQPLFSSHAVKYRTRLSYLDFGKNLGVLDMSKSILTGAVGMIIASTALAQTSLNRSQEREAIEVISAVEGAFCERVIRTQTIGELPDNTTLMAVACDGGDQPNVSFVISLDQRGNMSFYSTCDNLAEGTNNQVRCFSAVR